MAAMARRRVMSTGSSFSSARCRCRRPAAVVCACARELCATPAARYRHWCASPRPQQAGRQPHHRGRGPARSAPEPAIAYDVYTDRPRRGCSRQTTFRTGDRARSPNHRSTYGQIGPKSSPQRGRHTKCGRPIFSTLHDCGQATGRLPHQDGSLKFAFKQSAPSLRFLTKRGEVCVSSISPRACLTVKATIADWLPKLAFQQSPHIRVVGLRRSH